MQLAWPQGSLGYLLERAGTLEDLNLTRLLSRTPEVGIESRKELSIRQSALIAQLGRFTTCMLACKTLKECSYHRAYGLSTNSGQSRGTELTLYRFWRLNPCQKRRLREYPHINQKGWFRARPASRSIQARGLGSTADHQQSTPAAFKVVAPARMDGVHKSRRYLTSEKAHAAVRTSVNLALE